MILLMKKISHQLCYKENDNDATEESADIISIQF